VNLTAACILAFSSVALAACANHNAPIAAGPEPVVESARCVAIADSVLKNTLPSLLELSIPVGRPHVPRIPSDVRDGVMLHTTFLVQPNGYADTSSVSISGTSQSSYRRDMVEALREARFNVPHVDSCPVWGRGDFQQFGVRVSR
jgi:hypothetical protein